MLPAQVQATGRSDEREPYPAEARFPLDPEKILTPLKPYVESRVNVKPPARIDLLRGAPIVPLPAPT